jgi:hypothetical protein
MTLEMPHDGDVVVRVEQRNGKPVYVLHVSGVDQVLYHTRDRAIDQAVAYAKRQQARVWLASVDHQVTLLQDFRPAEAV